MPAVSRLLRTGVTAGPASPISPMSPRGLSTLPDISSKALKVTKTTTPKTMLPLKDLVFGHTFSDHMLIVEWSAKTGWEAPEIKPYGKLSLDPSCTVFHYAVECFEGMKAYKDKNGDIRLFRPDMNMNRLHRSCERLSLPAFNKEEFLESIKALLRLDSSWIPGERGYSLYIRPTAIATQESLGVGTANRSMLFVICSPVGPYYKTGFNPVSLFATEHYVRAWPGGTGDSKLGSNYAPGIRPQLEVAKDGFQQNLWLFGPDQQITEVGTMNFFCFWKTPEGKRQLITPALDGTILPGVTRDSILALTREWNEFEVVEGKLTMHELAKAVQENRVLEVFGAGTAAIVSPVKNIHWRGQSLDIPLDPKDTTQLAGPLTRRLADTIMGIQYGEIPHPWSVKI